MRANHRSLLKCSHVGLKEVDLSAVKAEMVGEEEEVPIVPKKRRRRRKTRRRRYKRPSENAA